MKRWVLKSLQVAALAGGGLLLSGTAAQADWNTGFNAGFNNGNQRSFTYQAPYNNCGNANAIVGFASARCDGGAYAYNNSGNRRRGGNWNSGYNAGFGNGNQSSFTYQAPYNNCGNSFALIGFASASCRGGAGAYNGG